MPSNTSTFDFKGTCYSSLGDDCSIASPAAALHQGGGMRHHKPLSRNVPTFVGLDPKEQSKKLHTIEATLPKRPPTVKASTP